MLAAREQPIVFRVRADPDPDHHVASVVSECSVTYPDPYGVRRLSFTNPLEVQAPVSGIFEKEPVSLPHLLAHLLW